MLKENICPRPRSSEPRSKQTKRGGLRAPNSPQPGKQSRGRAVRLPRCSLQRQGGGKAEQAKEAADPAPPVPQFCRLATLQRAGDTIRMEVSFSQGVWGWLSLYIWTN